MSDAAFAASSTFAASQNALNAASTDGAADTTLIAAATNNTAIVFFMVFLLLRGPSPGRPTCLTGPPAGHSSVAVGHHRELAPTLSLKFACPPSTAAACTPSLPLQDFVYSDE